MTIPRRIFALWDKPVAQAPHLVQTAFDAWNTRAAGYDMTILNGADMDRHLNELGLGQRTLTIQAKSDILRTKLLFENGGVWTDATVVPSADLDDWLPPLVEQSGFFAFARPDRDRPFASWLLAAEPHHPIPKALLDHLVWFWSVERRALPFRFRPRRWEIGLKRWMRQTRADPSWSVTPGKGAARRVAHYFFFHYSFQYLLDSDDDFARLWAQTPKRSAIPPHNLQNACRAMSTDELTGALPHLLENSPVHKLDWRMTLPEVFFDNV